MSIDLVSDEYGLLHATVPHPREPRTTVMITVIKAEDGWWAYINGQRIECRFRSAQQAGRAAEKEIRTLPGTLAPLTHLQEAIDAAGVPQTAQVARPAPRLPASTFAAVGALVMLAVTGVVVHATGLLDNTTANLSAATADTVATNSPVTGSDFTTDVVDTRPSWLLSNAPGKRQYPNIIHARIYTTNVRDTLEQAAKPVTGLPGTSGSTDGTTQPRDILQSVSGSSLSDGSASAGRLIDKPGNPPYILAPSSPMYARLRIEDQAGVTAAIVTTDNKLPDIAASGPDTGRHPGVLGQEQLQERAKQRNLRRRVAISRSVRRLRSRRLRAAIRKNRALRFKRIYARSFREAN